MNNQFQDFSNRMIAKHKGFGQAFDSAPMVFPEQESAGETGGTSIENHYIKNLYQIQNLKIIYTIRISGLLPISWKKNWSRE